MSVDDSVVSLPAVALMDSDGALERATDPFRQRYGEWPDALARDGQLTSIFGGQLDRTSVTVEGITVQIEAVHDMQGGRHALVTLPDESNGNRRDARPNAFLSERFDDSPALIWLKDLDGRYLHANRRFTELLNTAEERVLGRTDRELPPRDVVDGPRVHEGVPPEHEPLQLEYTIGPFEGRPAFGALRFAVRDRAGDPIGVCGVAAPLPEAHVARAECARLMEIARWSRLDSGEIKRELLDEWGMVHESSRLEPSAPPAPPAPQAPAEHPDAQLEAVLAARDAAITECDEALAGLEQARREIETFAEATADIERLTSELEHERQRVTETEAELSELRQLGDERHRFADVQAELVQARDRSAAEVRSLQSELQELQAALSDERQRAADSRAELDEARRRQTELQPMHNELELKNQHLEAELDRHRQRAEATSARLAASREERRRSPVERERLEAQLSQQHELAAHREGGTRDPA